MSAVRSNVRTEYVGAAHASHNGGDRLPDSTGLKRLWGLPASRARTSAEMVRQREKNPASRRKTPPLWLGPESTESIRPRFFRLIEGEESSWSVTRTANLPIPIGLSPPDALTPLHFYFFIPSSSPFVLRQDLPILCTLSLVETSAGGERGNKGRFGKRIGQIGLPGREKGRQGRVILPTSHESQHGSPIR